MIPAFSRIENAILQQFTDTTKDQECEAYCGYNFKIGPLRIKFRKAKITPKKTGQFVTLWKRNPDGQTEPFSSNDDFDFYIVAAEEEQKFGIFLFSKHVLTYQQILTSKNKEGKRGFRIYPNWDIPTSKQAEKTKKWQQKHFIDMTNAGNQSTEKFNAIIKDYS